MITPDDLDAMFRATRRPPFTVVAHKWGDHVGIVISAGGLSMSLIFPETTSREVVRRTCEFEAIRFWKRFEDGQ